MGATASTDIATHFFEESKSVTCHLDLNHKPSIRVSDEGVKLMPGGALVVETIECPLHQVGDGKGVSGHLRTVDSPIPESAESKLKANNKLVNDRIKLLKEKSLAMATETALSEFPGHLSKAAESKSDDIKPLIVLEGDRKSQDFFQVEATFSPKSLPAEGAKLLSSECPMQHKNLSPGTEPRPLSQNMTHPNVPVVDHASFTHQYGTMKQEKFNQKSSGDSKIMSPKRFSANQTFPLATDRVLSNIPKTDADDTWTNSARQMFWNAMMRKGWKWDNADMSTQEMENIISVYSANNQLAWREVLKWEAMHADECKEPKLKKFSIFATKYSLRARLRSWLGYELPFDRHDWIVDRNGKEVRYIIDYYDGGKMNTNFEFALLDVRPALDSFEALRDRVKVSWDRWTSKPQETIPPAANPVPDFSRIGEPLNFSKRPVPVSDGPDKFQETKPSRFMPYSLSDIEKERERKNSVS